MRGILVFAVTITAAIFIYFLTSSPVSAEVWLSNRYAQNCAACHSPSRRNVVAKDRRCTLACQGCHVNPNGGGLRNEYGVWTQQRWLRSFKSDYWKHKGTPAPLKYQKYANMPNNLIPPGGSSRSYSEPPKKSTSSKKRVTTKRKGTTNRRKGKGRSRGPAAATAVSQSEWNKWERMAREGFPLVVTSGVDYNAEDYDKSDRQEHITVNTRTEFLARMVDDDPWRLERQKSFFGGVDFRYFYLSGESKENGNKMAEFKGTMFPMALDVGIKWRPRPENISLVLEHRYMNGPTPDNAPNNGGQTAIDNIFTGTNAESQVRSAYLLVDDLPYATYVMYGLYRPMFGHMTPDHTTLLNNLLTADNRNGADAYNDFRADSAKMIHRALTIGGSPNVPFANIHYIMPIEDETFLSKYALARDRGFALNLGGRFVTLGASFMLSWWSTEGPREAGGVNLKTDMIGFTSGATFRDPLFKKDFIINVDFSTIEREYEPGSTDKGVVNTFEAKYRLWREMYLVGNFASSNVSRNLKAGSASEMMVGVKSFLYPGMEFELMMISREDKDKTNGNKTETDMMQGQLHMYF